MSVTPTRAARREILLRVDLADRAADLLRSKEEALLRERDRLRGHVQRSRLEWARCWTEAVAALNRARALGGSDEVGRACRLAPMVAASVSADWQVSMGITYPGEVSTRPGTSVPLASTAALGPAVHSFHEALVAASDHAAAATAVQRLEAELDATRRRRRAIEERLRPDLEETLRALDLRLDELDRDQAVRIRFAVDLRGGSSTREDRR